MFTLRDVFFAFVVMALLLLVGRYLKYRLRWLQRLYLPESIVAGVLALGLTQLGLVAPPIREVWRQVPGLFINLVFAALFLGETIPTPVAIWRKAAPQVVFGQALAWGQYVVGVLVTGILLVPLFNAHPLNAVLIEIAFEGGHGTAAGMADTLRQLGFQAGPDLALALATVGIVSGIIAGTALAAWGRRQGHVQSFTTPVPDQEWFSHQETPAVQQKRAKLLSHLLIDPLSLNLGFVGLAVSIGWLLLQGLMLLENRTWGTTGVKVMAYVPLFPMALIGGMLVQLAMQWLGLDCLILRPLVQRIAGTALDALIVAALASMSLVAIGQNLGPFLLLSAAGILWNVGFFLYYAPRLFPDYWFEKGIADLGQSMGVTATGLLLLRMVDPALRSGALESFAYKQLLFEPIVGGGLFTAAAPVLIHTWGLWPMLGLTGVILTFWLLVGAWLQQSARRRL
ncbi:MAG: sodium/glutamate symporter [Gloeomargarita sp. GMQP_bins_120]